MIPAFLTSLGPVDLSVLVLLLIGLATMVGGGFLYFGNLNRDVPSLDSPTRVGWGLILLSGILASAAVVLYIATGGLGR